MQGAAAHPNVTVALTLTAANNEAMEANIPGVTMLSGRISPAMIHQVCSAILPKLHQPVACTGRLSLLPVSTLVGLYEFPVAIPYYCQTLVVI